MVEEDDWREEDLKMRLKYYGGEERLGLRLDSHFNHCPSKQGRIYRSGGGDLWPAAFQSDRERVEHLFQLYVQMVRPLTAPPIGRTRRAAA